MNQAYVQFNFRKRVFVAGGIFVFCFGLIVGKIIYLMVIEAPQLRELAQRQHTKTIKLVPKRGPILDREGRVLAESVLVDSLYAHPNQMQDPQAVARVLAPILKVSESELLKLLDQSKSFVWIKRTLKPEEASAIRKLITPKDSPWKKVLVLIPEYARYYPEGVLAAQLIGFSGDDGSGLEGIEKRYDPTLSGEALSFVVERDAGGRTIYPSPDVIPNSSGGNRLVLTIDSRLQQIVEDALDEVMITTNAERAMAGVMKVDTGEILAMAVRPTFNPNDFKRFDPALYRNNFVTDIFEPGSTFKSFTLAGVLDTHALKSDDEFFCEEGAFEIDGSIINDTHSYGWFTVEEIIVHSSNIGAAKMGLKLGREKFEEYIRRFGFGEPTGIEITGENPGIVRSMRKISRVGVATISFGQGIGVTAIQLLSAFNAIANNGVWIKPTIINRIEDAQGNVVFTAAPQTRKVVDSDTAKEMTRIFTNVVHGGGTGGRAAPNGYLAAGKTGTAQKVNHQTGGYFEDKYVGSFVGFVPAKNPAITILVVVDDPKGVPFGGAVAAPAFKKIAERSLPLLGVLPDNARDPIANVAQQVAPVTIGTPATPAFTNAVNLAPYFVRQKPSICSTCMPDLLGMTLREVLVVASQRKVHVDIAGEGRVISQLPPVGTPLAGVNRWWVKLANDPY